MKRRSHILFVALIVALAPGSSFAATMTQSYTAPGTYGFTVPAGVTSVTATVIGAGGGGGSSNHLGDDSHPGGGGGSGGYQTATVSVTPGQTIAVTVGSGGNPGSWPGSSCPNYDDYPPFSKIGGSAGTASGFGSIISTGGAGGNGNIEDNSNGYPGVGGSPNGVSGSPNQNLFGPYNSDRNNYCQLPGGNNYTGYGLGGATNGKSAGGVSSWMNPWLTSNGGTYYGYGTLGPCMGYSPNFDSFSPKSAFGPSTFTYGYCTPSTSNNFQTSATAPTYYGGETPWYAYPAVQVRGSTNCTSGTPVCPVRGGNGAVLLSWTAVAVPTVNIQFQ